MTAVQPPDAEQDAAGADPNGFQAHIQADCIDHLYKNGFTPITAHLVLGSLLTWGISANLDHALAAVWLGLLATIQVARFALLGAYTHRRPVPIDQAPAWGWWFAAGAFASGATWGLAGLLFFNPDVIALEALLVITVFGIAMMSVAIHAAYPPAFLAFAPPAVVPLTLLYLGREEPERFVLGVMGVVFLYVLWISTRSQSRIFRESFRLRYRNADLLAQLQDQHQAAKAASQAKSDFIATVSHELRTPLTSVIGFAELLDSESFGPLGDPRYRAYVRDIRDSAGHLLDLINDILDLSRAEAGRLTLIEEEFELRFPVQAALRLVGDRAERAGLTLDAALPTKPLAVFGDQRALKQMLLNLLSNAIKFTPPGGRIGLAATRDVDGGLSLAISDTGIGMRPEEIPAALGRFEQAESARLTAHPGSGLGLPLVKTLIELHGGSLALSSALGAGTTATIRLPPGRVSVLNRTVTSWSGDRPAQPPTAAARHGAGDPGDQP